MSDRPDESSFINRLIPANLRLRELRLNEDEIAASNQYLRAALVEHKAEGLLLAVRARWVALLVVGIFLPFVNFSLEILYYELILGCFALIGWAQLRVGRVGRSGMELLLIFADLLLMTLTIVIPTPFSGDNWPTAMQYEIGNFIYFFVFLGSATLAYSWRTLVSYGTWLAGIWMTAAVLVSFLGHKIPELTLAIAEAVNHDPRLVEFLDPNRVDLGFRFQEMMVFVIVCCTLALNGWRTNRLLLRQANVARERANLARHFPPSIVDEMADRDHPLGEVRSQEVAVMFADIVGFTSHAERQTPEQTMELLREFHHLMESAVFNHSGTLHKFLGDGIMATFGTPEPSPQDGENALACADEMLSRMEKLNESRARQNQPPIQLSIGLHFGNVVLGDVGSERLLEFAVIGDAVNVASRLEEMTRELNTPLIVSDTLMQAAKLGRANTPALLQNLKEGEPLVLRGRDDPISIWTI